MDVISSLIGAAVGGGLVWFLRASKAGSNANSFEVRNIQHNSISITGINLTQEEREFCEKLTQEIVCIESLNFVSVTMRLNRIMIIHQDYSQKIRPFLFDNVIFLISPLIFQLNNYSNLSKKARERGDTDFLGEVDRWEGDLRSELVNAANYVRRYVNYLSNLR